MSGVLPILLLLLLAFIICQVVWTGGKAQERRGRLAALATRHGWRFDVLRDRNIRKQFEEIPLFQRGTDRYAENVIQGEYGGRRLLMFDYHYETESGLGKDRRTQHHHYGIVTLRSTFLLKPLVIRPGGLWDRITGAFGWGDIDFESAEFSRRYHVSGPDRRWAFDVITPRTMELLLAGEKFTLCMTRTDILFSRPHRLSPEQMLDGMALCAAVLDGIPECSREPLPDL